MEHESPEEYDDHVSDRESDEVEDHDIKAESGTSPTTKNAPAVKPAGHLQKRRRVTRACDECRRKKIKCDGKQPCTHCTVYSYDCTYDQPSNRRRNPAPQYVENLEHRVHRAETLLHILIPNLDLNDPGIEAAVAQGWIPGAPGKGHPAEAQEQRSARPPPQPHAELKSDANLESMVRAVAQLDMDETGHWDYHGHSSGLSFVRRMREQLGDLMGPDTSATPFVKTRPMSQVLDSPRSSAESPIGEPSPSSTDLPPRDVAKHMCTYAVNDAAALLRVVHQPTFWASFDRLYSLPPEHYTNEDQTFLPLFYSAVALGSLFGKDDRLGHSHEGYESAIQQGFSYFKIARQMMDIADCRDLSSIQAVVFIILFLQSSAKMSQCYAYVGVALRSALRMGLHRSAAGRFDPVEAETRKRVFWIVRKLDVYVGAMLGLPQTLSDEDIDQEFPMEIDDEYITKGGILPQPEGVVPLMVAFNAHTRLVNLLQKIVRKVYPIKVQSPQSPGDKSYSIPFSTIREIEGELEEWKNSLPPIFSPCDAPPRYTRIQHLLRLTYAHAQVMLYRPFLHFVAMEKRSKPVDQRAYACAASFVNVSRNVIHIASQMKQKGLLNGAFWFIMYTTFFSILALVYFAAENPDNPTTEAVMKDAIEGKEVLASIASKSMAADRCTATLNTVFSRLPAWMREGQQNPSMNKKRPFEQGPQTNHLASMQGPRGHHNAASSSEESLHGTKRASTFPRLSASGNAGASSSHESSWSQAGSSYGPQTPAGSSLDSNAYGINQRNVSHPMNSGMQQYALPPNFANPQLTDLSTMMFPTADEPLVYPNQPLTTFENNQYAKTNSYVNQQPYTSIEGPSSVMAHSSGHDENIEAQFFALPPYIEQGRTQQQLVQSQQAQRGMTFPQAPYTNGQANNAAQALPVSNDSWSSQQGFQQQDMTNINIQDLFGGAEWNPMFQHPGYQNQR